MREVVNIQDKNAVLVSNAEHLKKKAHFLADLLIQTREGYREHMSSTHNEMLRSLRHECGNGTPVIYDSLHVSYMDNLSNARRSVKVITTRLAQSITDAESAMASAEAHTRKYFRWLKQSSPEVNATCLHDSATWLNASDRGLLDGPAAKDLPRFKRPT